MGQATRETKASTTASYVPSRVPPVVIGLAILGLIGLGLWYLGPPPVVIIGGSLLIAFAFWLKTTYRKPADYREVLPLYLALIAAELVHMAEEYITDFPGHLTHLFGMEGYGFDRDAFLVAFVFGGGALAVLSAAGLMYRNPYANYFLWFLVIGPGLVNGIAHIAFPLIAGTVYFPGLITVALPTVIGVMLLLKLLGRWPARRKEEPMSRSNHEQRAG